MTHHPIVYTAARDDAGMRLDLFIARQYEDQSRSQIQKAIEDGHVLVNGRSSKTGLKLKAGDVVEMAWPEPKPSIMLPEAMDLDILYEDAHLLVLNKPAGLVVHPAAGHHSGTLVNGLLYHCRDLSGIGGVLRPGIVPSARQGHIGTDDRCENGCRPPGIVQSIQGTPGQKNLSGCGLRGCR